jgi:glycosyltransferase involved in cell wall biosynthesis
MNATEPDVLHVITRSDWGGAQRIVTLLAAEAEANTAVACGTGGKLIDELRARETPVFEQSSLQSPPGPADARAFVDLYRLLRRESFDLVHCHSTKAGMVGRSAARLTGTPTVFTVHSWGFYNTGYDWAAPVMTRIERFLARSTDALVCVSENDLAEGRDRGIVQRTHSEVIHNGVPPISVPSDRRTLFEEAGIEPGTVVVGAIARLVDQKNPIEIVRIAGELQRRGHDATAVVIGDGPLGADCKRYADDHGIEIHLLGFRERALELLLDFDVFLLPSEFEGFPLTVLESLHAGVPVVAYDVGGVGEAVVDGETGFVVAPGDATAFADRVERLVTDADRRNEMGNHAKTVAAKEFTAQRMAAEYDQLYADVLSRS